MIRNPKNCFLLSFDQVKHKISSFWGAWKRKVFEQRNFLFFRFLICEKKTKQRRTCHFLGFELLKIYLVDKSPMRTFSKITKKLNHSFLHHNIFFLSKGIDINVFLLIKYLTWNQAQILYLARTKEPGCRLCLLRKRHIFVWKNEGRHF